MTKHENDLNPRPLTVSGFKGGSCRQDNLPDSNRTPDKPTVIGQPGLRKYPGDGSRIYEYLVVDNPARGKLKNKFMASGRNPLTRSLPAERTFAGYPACIVAPGFAKRTAGSEFEPEKAWPYTVNGVWSSFKLCDDIWNTEHGINLKPACRTVYNHSGLTDTIFPGLQVIGKSSFKGIKASWLNGLIDSLSGQDYPGN
jgi:hypothetical protein